MPRLLVPAVAYVAALAVLIGLGMWQVQRLAWKQDLIATVDARTASAPVPLPPAAAWNGGEFLERFAWQPVTVRGRFEPAAGGGSRFYVYTVVAEPRGAVGGQGYWALDVFRPESGGAVLVNRGFVPYPQRGEEPAPPDDPVTIAGLVRRPLGRTSFTPACADDAPVCYTVDLERAAALAGDVELAPFYIDLAAGPAGSRGLPQAGETRVTFANNHLGYAVTWFGLAAALTAVFGAYVLSLRRQKGAS